MKVKHLPFLLLIGAFAGCSPKAYQMSASGTGTDSPNKSPLVILDGKPLPPNSSLSHLSQEDIGTVKVIKNDEENREYLDMTYGPAAKDGVIITTTNAASKKEKTELHSKLQAIVEEYGKTPVDYLFVKDGILVAPEEVSKLNELEASDLTAVEVLPNTAAKAIYGEKAKKITVLVNTRFMNAD